MASTLYSSAIKIQSLEKYLNKTERFPASSSSRSVLDFLRRLGKVLHVSAAHNIILRVEGDPPRVGETVVNIHRKPVGRVYDVFGSVSRPYVSVKPCVSESSCAKQVLYVLSSKARR